MFLDCPNLIHLARAKKKTRKQMVKDLTNGSISATKSVDSLMNYRQSNESVKVNKVYYMFIYKQPCKAHFRLNKNIQYICFSDKQVLEHILLYMCLVLRYERRPQNYKKMFSQLKHKIK